MIKIFNSPRSWFYDEIILQEETELVGLFKSGSRRFTEEIIFGESGSWIAEKNHSVIGSGIGVNNKFKEISQSSAECPVAYAKHD